jgi:hypothetical protein
MALRWFARTGGGSRSGEGSHIGGYNPLEELLITCYSGTNIRWSFSSIC